MSRPRAHRTGSELRHDPARVVARLFLPGEEPHLAHSRAQEIVARVLALDEAEVDRLIAELIKKFAHRHRDYQELLISHASVVASHVGESHRLSEARTLLLGATFTAEYAVEGAAVCNPSAVLHPDQSALDDGQTRVAVSVRGIGEGHVSSIGFRSAIVGPGARWSWAPASYPVSGGVVSSVPWRRAHLRAVLADQCDADELAQGVLRALPVRFTETDLERELSRIHPRLVSRPGAAAMTQLIRQLVSSAYEVTFDADVALDERIIMPAAADESHGMEDARFTRFVGADGTVGYRATYTAYDGRRIVPRLLTSPDLRTFQAHRLAGPAARNKGMALFPRLINGRHLALCRADGENSAVASSADGFTWTGPQLVHEPTRSWETVQVGNCGPPIETDSGWLVLTHGVGAMRTYSIGAILLDLDDPSVVLGSLDSPLLEPEAGEQDGYVPNVVYSCGGFVHDELLWLPYGIGDIRIGVAYVPLAELLAALRDSRPDRRPGRARTVS
jgi:predicted GH43/DUF377 family glycosyl hydrolase